MKGYWQLHNCNTESFRDGTIEAESLGSAQQQAESIMSAKFDDVEWETLLPQCPFAYKKAGKHHFYLDMAPFQIPNELTN